MPLSCGCEMRGGMPITPGILEAHYKHTFEALLFWELIMRPGADEELGFLLTKARINYIKALEAKFPEIKMEGQE